MLLLAEACFNSGDMGKYRVESEAELTTLVTHLGMGNEVGLWL